MRETKPIITLGNVSEWNTGLYFRGNLTLVEQHRESSRNSPCSNNRWLPRKGVALAIPIVRAVEADRTKGGIDRPGRTVRYVGWGYQQLSFLVEAGRARYRHKYTGGFATFGSSLWRGSSTTFVPLFLLLPVSPSALSHSPPFRPLRPRTLKQNEGDARRAFKDNDYEA